MPRQNCGYRPDNVPQIDAILQFLKDCTGFTLCPAMGLLRLREFLNSVAFRTFHSTQYIRHHYQPTYTLEPDCCHELLSHMPLFADPNFAELAQEIGLASLGASDKDIQRLATIFWFTANFGICHEGTDVCVYGVALLSSFGEADLLMHADSNDKELDARRKQLYSNIKGQEWPLDFEAFIESLGVEEQYNRFIKDFPSLFLDLAKASPVLQNKKLVTNTERTPDESDVFRTVPPTSLNMKEEFRYVKFVDQSLTVMSEKVDALNKNILDNSAKAPALMLVIEDRQEAAIVGSAHKPDLAFYHRAVIKRGITTVDFVLEAKMDLAPNGPSDKTGAVYDILHSGRVEHIPKVISSGLLYRDSGKYRLGFVLMEDCGLSMAEYLKGKPDDQKNELVPAFVNQLTLCLAQARAAGILHRDISAGNICIKNGQACIIDWGCAKFVDEGQALDKVEGENEGPTIIAKVAKTWEFDAANVAQNETDRDPLTGTPLFMSIPMLCQSPARGILEDLESVFYVILDAVRPQSIERDKVNGFNFMDGRTIALFRFALFQAQESYLKDFCIKQPSTELKKLLDAMRQFLFEPENQFISHRLWSDKIFDRQANWDAAPEFMHPEAIRILQGPIGQIKRPAEDEDNAKLFKKRRTL
ncbi:hypothetical protein LPJ66_001706 [Kickxella alabastrina]|uniref:Uncharacterized protein n=1 Tax=Kickxella alabastrina TaxID=61397 RepID=A0ACC1ISS2_9FUNG|nr:hypothetical protein LPJ66_001706 [Kickxella alabastrina]